MDARRIEQQKSAGDKIISKTPTVTHNKLTVREMEVINETNLTEVILTDKIKTTSTLLKF
jgi:hypothetical protein